MNIMCPSTACVVFVQTALAGLFLKAGVQNQRVALLLTDAQIPDDRFLVIVNDFLASGQTQTSYQSRRVVSSNLTNTCCHHRSSISFTVWLWITNCYQMHSGSEIILKLQRFVWSVTVRRCSLLVCNYDCVLRCRRCSWGFQWGGDWEYRVGCESRSTRPWTFGQHGELLEVLHRPSATAAHGLFFSDSFCYCMFFYPLMLLSIYMWRYCGDTFW